MSTALLNSFTAEQKQAFLEWFQQWKADAENKENEENRENSEYLTHINQFEKKNKFF